MRVLQQGGITWKTEGRRRKRVCAEKGNEKEEEVRIGAQWGIRQPRQQDIWASTDTMYRGRKLKNVNTHFENLISHEKSYKVQPIKQNPLFIVAGRQHQALFQVPDFCHKAFILTVSVQFGHSQTMMHKKELWTGWQAQFKRSAIAGRTTAFTTGSFFKQKGEAAGNSLG